MCTLVVAANVVPGRPLVVVANRDERLDRPSSPPQTWNQGFFAPRDELAGGTWLGVNRQGVFVGITNRYLGAYDATRRSRGDLVVRALEQASARAIHDAMRSLDPATTNAFHLVYADGKDVLATVSDGVTLAQLVLGDGLVVVTERSFGAGDDRRRVERIAAAWDRLAPDRLNELLTEHDEADPLAATCVHVPQIGPAGYGTRSAMVLTRSAAGDLEMMWAEGPPCTTPFVPLRVDFG